jgi:AcrR family transcriptional regulator
MSTFMTDGAAALPTGIPMPKQERSRRTREKIIEAAIQLFEERGFEKTTSNDIAAAAGVSIGSFYAYFTDKRKLLLLIFEQLVSERLDAVFSNFPEEDLLGCNGRQCIRDSVERVFQNKAVTPGLNRILHEMAEKDPDINAIRKDFIHRSVHHLGALLEKAREAGRLQSVEVPVAAAIIIHAVDAIAMQCVLIDQLGPAQWAPFIDGVTDMILAFGFQPPQNSEPAM